MIKHTACVERYSLIVLKLHFSWTMLLIINNIHVVCMILPEYKKMSIQMWREKALLLDSKEMHQNTDLLSLHCVICTWYRQDEHLNTSLGHNRLISTVDTVIEHQHYTVYDNFSLIIRSETADKGGGTSVRTLPESFSTVQMRGELHTSTPIKDFNMDALT